jgi:hypothetical protein
VNKKILLYLACVLQYYTHCVCIYSAYQCCCCMCLLLYLRDYYYNCCCWVFLSFPWSKAEMSGRRVFSFLSFLYVLYSFWPFAAAAAGRGGKFCCCCYFWFSLMNDVASLRDLMTFGCPLQAFEQHLNRSSSFSLSLPWPAPQHIFLHHT